MLRINSSISTLQSRRNCVLLLESGLTLCCHWNPPQILAKLLCFIAVALSIAGFQVHGGERPSGPKAFLPSVPRIYEDAEVATWHLPLVMPQVSPAFLHSGYFNSRKIRVMYRSYPVYHSDYEPVGYLEQLKASEPEVLWDGSNKRPRLETRADWVRAGEMVYHAPFWPRPVEEAEHLRRRELLKAVDMPVARDGSLPGLRYVIRERGKVEVAFGGCAVCHTRVVPGGMLIDGTQGNLPLARLEAFEIRNGKSGSQAEMRKQASEYHATPWWTNGPNSRLAEMTTEDLAQAREACPPGVYPNHNGGLLTPTRTAELRGQAGRRYMDSTGHMRHRGPSDLMRFIDFHQWGSRYASFGQYRPQEIPAPEEEERYSDEQAYALALYIYSLRPIPNPSPPRTVAEKALVSRGRKVFMDPANRCASCHDPKQGYTNNKLTPVDGFSVPADHPEKAHIMSRSVHTDPTLALHTRKGTGFYRVPTLIGLWHRGPFEHNGSVATLEDWFDPRRLRDDYVPTGWKGPPGTRSRAVRGHEYGLDLSAEDKAALIAFLKTL